MSMVEQMELSLVRLRVALATMDEDHRGFETTLAEAPDFHSERGRAGALHARPKPLFAD
jgi:hypothetical protein